MRAGAWAHLDGVIIRPTSKWRGIRYENGRGEAPRAAPQAGSSSDVSAGRARLASGGDKQIDKLLPSQSRGGVLAAAYHGGLASAAKYRLAA